MAATPRDIQGFEQLAQHLRNGNEAGFRASLAGRAGATDATDALTYFVENDDSDSAALLLQNARRGDRIARHAFYEALLTNNFLFAKKLAAALGVDVDKELVRSIKDNDTRFVPRLLKLDVDISAVLMHVAASSDPTVAAASNPNIVALVRLLGGDPQRAMLYAAQHRDVTAAKTLLDIEDINLAEVIERAIENDDEGSVAFLLDLGNPVNNLAARA